MKNLLTLILFGFITTSMMGQYVTQGDKPMTNGTFYAYTVTIEGMEAKIVEKEWQKYMKDHSGKTKRDRKSGQSLTTGAAIGGIGGDVVVHASAIELGSNVQFTAWFESDEIFVEDSEVAVGVMERFIVHMKRVRIQMELDNEADRLKELQKELNQEEKNEQRNHDDIAKYEKKIEEAEQNIAESKKMQELKTEEIELQQGVIEQVKNRLNRVSLEDEVEEEMEEEEEEGKSKKAKKSKKDKSE